MLPFCFQTLLGGKRGANKNPRNPLSYRDYFWLRGQDSNLRPSGYEVDDQSILTLVRSDEAISDIMRTQKGPACAGPFKSLIFGCGGRIRTCDLQVMSLTCNDRPPRPASRCRRLRANSANRPTIHVPIRFQIRRPRSSQRKYPSGSRTWNAPNNIDFSTQTMMVGGSGIRTLSTSLRTPGFY